MKEKSRMTAMICTVNNGEKLPIGIFGKPNKSICFRLVTILHIPYINQHNTWFDSNVTVWWINNVYWHWPMNHHGDIPLILLLDNCTAHSIDLSQLPKI